MYDDQPHYILEMADKTPPNLCNRYPLYDSKIIVGKKVGVP